MTPKEALSELKALKPGVTWFVEFILAGGEGREYEDWTIEIRDAENSYREYWEGETLEEVMEKVRKGLKPS